MARCLTATIVGYALREWALGVAGLEMPDVRWRGGARRGGSGNSAFGLPDALWSEGGASLATPSTLYRRDIRDGRRIAIFSAHPPYRYLLYFIFIYLFIYLFFLQLLDEN